MPFRDRDRDRENLNKREFPDPDEDDPNFLCPYCRVPIYEEAEQCPCCGTYLSEEEQAQRGKPWWIVAGAIACLIAAYMWLRHP